MNRTFQKPGASAAAVDPYRNSQATALNQRAAKTQNAFNKGGQKGANSSVKAAVDSVEQKYFNEFQAITLLDEMLRSGRDHSKEGVMATSFQVSCSGPPLISSSDWNSTKMKKDLDKADRKAKMMRQSTSFKVPNLKQRQKHMAGEFKKGRESKLIQSYSLQLDDHAISEGAISETISSNQITETNENDSENNNSKLSLATFKKLINQMNQLLTRMDFEEVTLENPPDCNTKLHDQLVAHTDKAKSNNQLRRKLEMVGDPSGFKIKNPSNEQMRQIQTAFDNI